MGLISWVNNNGVVVFLIMMSISIVAGTMPPLPDDAGYFAKWFYAIMKFLSFNLRGIGNSLQQFGVNVKMPELQVSSGTGPPVGSPEAIVNRIIGVTGTGPGTASTLDPAIVKEVAATRSESIKTKD